MDADMTHPPHLMREMVDALRNCDVCVASRFVGNGGMVNVPWYRVLISRFANVVYQILFLSPVKDNTTGYKAYRSGVIKSVDIQETGFAVQLEIMTKLLKKNARFAEIPFELINRKLGTSKLRYLKAIPHYLRHVLHLLSIRWL
jgi:dolichol-phosphate mannosyltransferase